MADQQQGLAGALDQQPDLSAAPPQTPQEFEQRKSQWGEVLQKVQSDPNIMRAIAVAGIRMMQPGATFGQGIASGYGAWEAGNAAAEDSARQAQIDQQNAAYRGAQTAAVEQQTQQRAAIAPLELRRLQADVDAIPDEKARRRAQLELDTFKTAEYVDQYPLRLEQLRANIGTTKNQGEAALLRAQNPGQGGTAQQQFDKMFEIFLAEEQLKNPTAKPATQNANAMRAALNERYAASTGANIDKQDQIAIQYFLDHKDVQPGSSAEFMLGSNAPLWSRGKALAIEKGLIQPGNDTGTKEIGKESAKSAIKRTAIYDKDGNVVGFK